MPRTNRVKSNSVASPVDLNDLAALLARANAPLADEVPEGWHTTKQWAAKWGCKLAWATHCLTRFKEAGMVEVRKLRIQSPQRGLVVVPHYFIHAGPQTPA